MNSKEQQPENSGQTEEYLPNDEELAVLRGLPMGNPQTEPPTQNPDGHEQDSSEQLSEIERARLDLMLASLEAAADEVDLDQIPDRSPLIPMSESPEIQEEQNATEEFVAPYRPPHAISRGENHLIATIMDQIVKDDIARFRKNMKSR